MHFFPTRVWCVVVVGYASLAPFCPLGNGLDGVPALWGGGKKTISHHQAKAGFFSYDLIPRLKNSMFLRRCTKSSI